MVFQRLRSVLAGKPRVGDLVNVIDGPYAGKSGTVTAVDGDVSTVYIDECCQPQLLRASIDRIWRGRNIHMTARHMREADEDGEMARYILEQHDQQNSL